MTLMTAEQGEKRPSNMHSDWWLWPSALLLAMAGWGQALWMWDNIDPAGLAPLWLLAWTGLGMAGITLALYWFARRWWPFAWLAIGTWAVVPKAIELVNQNEELSQTASDALYSFSPLWILLLLGIGFGGAMMSLAWYAGRRWSDRAPKARALREALWAALFVVISGLLFISRAFSLASVILLAGGLVLIETYLVVRESIPEPDERGIPEV